MHGKWLLTIFLVLALAVVGAACTPPVMEDGNNRQPDAGLLDDADQQAVVDNFMALLNRDAMEATAIGALEEHLALLAPEKLAQMALALEGYQKQQIEKGGIISQDLVDLIQERLDTPYLEQAINNAADIADPELQEAVQNLLERGYKIITPEGMYEPVINYDVYRAFVDYLPADIKDYIAIKAAESDQRLSSDAAIIIPIGELYSRLRQAEDFLLQHSGSNQYEAVKAMYDIYASAYFYGQNNTPAFDYATNKLKQEFLDSYQAAAADSGQSAVAQAVKDYLIVLEDNDYALSDALSQYRENLVRQLTAANFDL
ncbi:MAG: hypothetical protein GX572_05655 [Clostridia bacterium]|nr:hypothetical protein [Clostridia bacterium]